LLAQLEKLPPRRATCVGLGYGFETRHKKTKFPSEATAIST